MQDVKICDTTLRDGEQTAGVVFANEEKLRIAKLLDKVGVDQIEAGVPVMGGDERESIEKIVDAELGASIMGWNRAVVSDVKASLDCGVDAVAVSVSTSDIHIDKKLNESREWVLNHMTQATEYAKSKGLYVSVNAEDSTRSDFEFLVEFAQRAKEAGADRLRYCDTVGIMTPLETHEAIKNLKKEVNIAIEMHTHNDFGLAAANALTGAKGGAKYIGTTVNGLGERAGNAPLEEIVMALKHLEDLDLGFNTSDFLELSEYVARASAQDLPVSKAIVGSNTFAHESGIHADGVLKDSETYEAFKPQEVGAERQLVIGKHSGKKAILAKFEKEYGIELTDEEAEVLLPKVRKMAVELKRALFDKELVSLYEELELERTEKTEEVV
ncbi:MAG: homocitrate synthase [Candidatus Bipolaricaulota bacterium]|nr:homocitrate synthase [Candidatus Bipolaricaulota bacterium]MBS3791369.1 homocitrate synthase [Candidatus Bipolaricaulota bacterium]